MKTYEDKNWSEEGLALLADWEAQFLMGKPKDHEMIANGLKNTKVPADEAEKLIYYYFDKPHAVIRNSYVKPLYLTELFSHVQIAGNEIVDFTLDHPGLIRALQPYQKMEPRLVIEDNELWIRNDYIPDCLVCILHKDKVRTDDGN